MPLSLAYPRHGGGGSRRLTVGLSLRLKISWNKVSSFRGFYPDGVTKRLCVILSGVELLRAAERAKARAVCGDAGSRNESWWLVTVLLLFSPLTRFAGALPKGEPKRCLPLERWERVGFLPQPMENLTKSLALWERWHA